MAVDIKMLFLDIETAPNIATVWGIWQQNVALSQLLETSYVLCWGAKWKHSQELFFASVQSHSKKQVIKAMWRLLDEADVVVHYNGRRFDIPVLNREFLLYGLGPPSPFKQIDLLRTIQRRFRFTSSKLAHVTEQLGLKGKVKVDHELWLKVMANDPAAWEKMEEYNKRDVTELEQVYNILLPWIVDHANLNLYINAEKPICTTCGSNRIQRRGTQYNSTLSYKRYKCMACGSWMRSRFAEKQDRGKESFVKITE